GGAREPRGAGGPNKAEGVGPCARMGGAGGGAPPKAGGGGKQEKRDSAHAVIDRSRGARDAARRRATADVHLLAEADLEPQHVRGGLRPEGGGGAGAGQACHHEAVDLVLVGAGLL